MSHKNPTIPCERIEKSIFLIRGQKVMLDANLAELYGVPVKRLNEQVKRNADRFFPDFAFQMTSEEYDSLRSQFATLERGRGSHRKYFPWAFTEHGAIMAANVLNSRRTVEASVYVVRAFVRLRWVVRPTGNWPASWRSWNAGLELTTQRSAISWRPFGDWRNPRRSPGRERSDFWSKKKQRLTDDARRRWISNDVNITTTGKGFVNGNRDLSQRSPD
jgi:hypothetical protein